MQLRRFIALCSLLVLAGCATAPAPEGAGQAAVGADNSALAGMVFETNIPPGVAQPSGDWRLLFDNGGRVVAHHQGSLVYQGEYAVTGGQLRISNRSGTYGCSGRAATYDWSISGSMLNLLRRDDPCTTISRVFTEGRWQRR
jgi:hypothetical protein